MLCPLQARIRREVGLVRPEVALQVVARRETLARAADDVQPDGIVTVGGLEGIEQLFAPDCSFQEGNDEPIQGSAAQSKRLGDMFAGLKSFDGATLHSQAIGDGVSITEWTFNMTAGNGDPIVWNEVLVRSWHDGKVVRERYYQA